MDPMSYPLVRAARQGTRTAVRKLLASGAPVAPWVEVALDAEGTTLLHVACARGLPELVTALLAAGAEVDAADGAGTRPLHEALHAGHLKIAEALIAHGAALDSPDREG